MIERIVATISLPYQTESGMSYIPGLSLAVKRWLWDGVVMVKTPDNPYTRWVLLRPGEYQFRSYE